MNIISGSGYRWLCRALLLAMVMATSASLMACGKKASLEKPGTTSEAKQKKPA